MFCVIDWKLCSSVYLRKAINVSLLIALYINIAILNMGWKESSGRQETFPSVPPPTSDFVFLKNALPYQVDFQAYWI